MEKKSCIVIVMALGLSLAAMPALSAPNLISNGGFETGDFTYWAVSLAPGGNAKAEVTTHKDALGAGPGWDPTEGDYFAWLKTDGGGQDTTLTKKLAVGPNYWAYELDFDVYFDAGDFYLAGMWNDYGYAKLIDSAGGEIVLYAKDVATVGDFGWDGWTHVKHTFTAAGIYTLQFGVGNTLDDSFDSALGVDNVTMVPAPGAVLLGIIGLGMAGWKARRRQEV
jgi:hypothetical protein